MKTGSNEYLVRNTYRSFLLVSVLSMMSTMLGGLIDNIVVGHFLAALREQAADDPKKNLGLRVINGITDSFEYRSGIGLNICLMTLKR